MRLGLCCLFAEQDIRFRTTTASALSRLGPLERVARIRELAGSNAAALSEAISWCAAHDIGCFRAGSQILPLKTHPTLGYDTELLGEEILRSFRRCGDLARSTGTRISFHPDQFVVLSSPDPLVVKSSLAEIEYQAEVGAWIGADVINVHGGGGYGDKREALRRLAAAVGELSFAARSMLTIENDDRTYTPSDLLPLCHDLGLPLVYDVHHHRCHGDGLSVEGATQLAVESWNRKPLFHISSPRGGWQSRNPRLHDDHVDPCDFPAVWFDMDLTVEVEAKAKELAVGRLRRELELRRGTGAAASSSRCGNDSLGHGAGPA